MPKEHTILTVFDALGLQNEGSFDNPAGAGWAPSTWDKYAYMITTTKDAIISGNTTSNLQITVGPGDTINWLDTPIMQGMRTESGMDYDMVVYGMRAGSNWDQVLEPLQSSFPNMSHVYISRNFNAPVPPGFTGVGYPNNVCSAKVKDNVPASTTVTYYLKVVKLDVRDLNNIRSVGWYQIDPKIIVKRG